MNRQGFEERVRERAPRDVSDEVLEMALFMYTEFGSRHPPYSAGDVQDVVQGMTAGLYRSGGGNTTTAPVAGLLNKPSGAILAGEWWDSLEDWAEAVRRDVEDRAEHPVELPVADYGAAVDWIRREEGAATGSERRPSDLFEELRKLRQELNEGADVEVVVGTRSYHVPYTPADAEWRRLAQGPKGSALWVLGKAVKQRAPGTPFSARALVGFVLADLRTPIVPVSIQISVHHTGHREVQLTVRVPDLSNRDVRTIRDRVRGAWGARGSKALTTKDRAVYVTVRGMGGREAIEALERGEHRPFWEEVRQRLADRGFEYGRYESVQQAWDRLEARVGSWRDGEPDIGVDRLAAEPEE